MSNYTFQDHIEGKCSVGEIGQARQSEIVVEAIPTPDFSGMSDLEISQTATRFLRTATMDVFAKLGAQDWLFQIARENPKEFLRLLQKLIPQSIEASVTVSNFEIPQVIREMTLEDLERMRSKLPIDAEFTTL